MARPRSFEALKGEWNKVYNEAQVEGLAPVVKKHKLQRALSSYENAVPSLDTDDQRASMWKNTAAAATSLASLNLSLLLEDNEPINSKRTAENEAAYYLLMALTLFGKAHLYGESAKSDAWQAELEDRFLKCTELVMDFHRMGIESKQDADHFLRKVLSACKDLPWAAKKTPALLTLLCDVVYELFLPVQTGLTFDVSNLQSRRSSKAGYVSKARKDAEALQQLNELQEPLCIAQQVLPHVPEKILARGGPKQDSLLDLDALQETLELVESGLDLGRSIHALIAAQEQLSRSSRHDQAEGLWDVLDSFREASKFLGGKHVDLDAFVMTKIAEVYGKLSNYRQAHAYYNRAVEFALSTIQSKPTLRRTWWFTNAVAEVDRFQQKLQQKEDKEKKKLVGDLEELEKELKEVQSLSSSGCTKVIPPRKDHWPQAASTRRL